MLERFAFSRAGGEKVRKGPLKEFDDRGADFVLRGFGLGRNAGKRQHFRNGKGLRIGGGLENRRLQRKDAREYVGVKRRRGRGFVGAKRHAHFHLAARQALLQGFAKEGFDKAEFFAHAKVEVEKTAVDGTAFDRGDADGGLSRRHAVAGHAGNHGHVFRYEFTLVKAEKWLSAKGCAIVARMGVRPSGKEKWGRFGRPERKKPRGQRLQCRHTEIHRTKEFP